MFVTFLVSFREDETKVKMQLVDLFHCKTDVYTKQLQVRMLISVINSPAACSRSCLWTQGVSTTEFVQNWRANSDIEHHNLLTSMPVFGTTFAARIKCHSKTLDRFKERK